LPHQAQKSYVEIEAFNRKAFDSEAKSSSYTSNSTDPAEGANGPVVVSQRKSARYEPNIWKTPEHEEEKPSSEVEHLV
jgi:hypothetical protein